MTQSGTLFNPFPGLRPFEPDEDHLFFGRETETDELLRRFRTSRFLSIVGTSGCGKSSLVRSGLIPSLHGGFMVKAGSSWRVSMLRPGEDPIGYLARALDVPEVIGATYEGLATTSRVVMEAALRRGPRGLIEAVRHAHIPNDENILIVVDQFEELFRFQRGRQLPNAREEAVAFVKLLLEATAEEEVPIYVVVTMRSDFIGDCIDYPGLPEAMNAGQYLVPRLTRDQLRSAITGPIAVAGGEIAPRLVLRLLNDLGNDQDQLPVLQHALMRTWDHWMQHPPGEPMDIGDYEAVGTLRHALSYHAEEAYLEATSDHNPRIVELIFKALTETFTDPRGVRRPCAVEQLAAIAGAPETDVVRVVEIFRRPGRTFLMPPSTPLNSGVIVDLSHESLMRGWTRLIDWAQEERASAAIYLRLTRAAAWFEEGTAGLWRDPELELGLRWKREVRPTAAWAQRYDSSFDRAMSFLEKSEAERTRLAEERRAERRRKLRQLEWTAALLAVMLAIAVTAGYVARRESARARSENVRAEENLRLARAAVDQSLAVVENNPASLAVDVPQLIRFRRQLLDKAQNFYREFIKQAPSDEEIRREMALAHFTLGHINRALDAYENAASEYRQAVEQFGSLARDYPARLDYRQTLANSHNWLGEMLRPFGGRSLDAKEAYDSAMEIQEQLHRQDPANTAYTQDFARTHYNRGILYSINANSDQAVFKLAEADFRKAIQLLEPLVGSLDNLRASQELGRACNNLASLLAGNRSGLTEAQRFYERAIGIHEGLVKRDPENREYKVELAKFYNNLAGVLSEQGETDFARQRNDEAFNLLNDLAQPSPSLGIERADSHNLRGRILDGRGWRDAVQEYRQSLSIFRRLETDEQARRLPEFHVRFGDLLMNLAILSRRHPDVEVVRSLLSEAVGSSLALAMKIAASGSPAEARGVLDTFVATLPELPERDRKGVVSIYQKLEQRLKERAAG